MTVLEVIAGICVMTPLILVLMALLAKNTQAMTRWFTRLGDMLVRVWESIMILFGKRQPDAVEGNVKMTLDEMDMTLEEASDAHYDAKALQKIRVAHGKEQAAWENEFNRIEKVKWMLENDDPDIVEEATVEVLRDWEGNVVSKRITPRASKTTRIVHRQGYGISHSSKESCYYCERK